MSIAKFILNIICPRFCVGCRKWGEYVCDSCGEDILFMSEPLKLNVTTNYIDEAWAMAKYQGMIENLIKELKYKGVKDLALVGGYYLWQFCHLPTVDMVTFVPIHKKRFKERGFNQSKLLASELSKQAQLHFFPVLKRDLYREKQALSKNKEERQTKVRGVFELTKQAKELGLENKKILIIDDVITTGATLNECARILKKAGVSKVYALCLAHGS